MYFGEVFFSVFSVNGIGMVLAVDWRLGQRRPVFLFYQYFFAVVYVDSALLRV